MPEYVRVRDVATGHEITVRADRVPDGAEVLDKPALGRDGSPRPPKYRVPLGAPRAGSSQMDDPPPLIPVTNNPDKTAKSAEPQKEN